MIAIYYVDKSFTPTRTFSATSNQRTMKNKKRRLPHENGLSGVLGLKFLEVNGHSARSCRGDFACSHIHYFVILTKLYIVFDDLSSVQRRKSARVNPFWRSDGVSDGSGVGGAIEKAPTPCAGIDSRADQASIDCASPACRYWSVGERRGVPGAMQASVSRLSPCRLRTGCSRSGRRCSCCR